jgi:uncharacterized protein (DUF1697 family)
MKEAGADSGSGRRVALIRGINVGRAKRVPMADLRALMADLSYTDVQTLLNSGNVVFTDCGTGPAAAQARIEERIASRFGIAVRVTVLTASELDTAVHGNPLLGVADNPSRLLVAFLAEPANRSLLEPLLEREWAPEALALGSRVAYVWCPDGVLQSSLNDAIGSLAGELVTARNWRTTMKIHAAIHEQA